MAGARRGSSMPAMHRIDSRTQLVAVTATLVLLDAIGVGLAAAGGLKTAGEALLQGSYVNAPLVIVGVQVLGVALVVLARGRAAVTGAVLFLAASSLSTAAVLFDGDVGHAGLGTGEIAYQGLCSAVTFVAVASGARWLLGRRARRAGAPGMIGA
jgi:hypothetical protein